jgi:hypothetical protein
MPSRPPKQCNSCKGRYTGRYCPTCSKGWATRKPKSWRGGSTPAWRLFRADWLANHPVCMDFGKRDGCTGVATVVCHRPGTDYERDRCNPAAIEGQRCKACDAVVTGQQGGRASRGTPT